VDSDQVLEQKRRLRILLRVVKRKQQGQNQSAETTTQEVASVPLFTEFLGISYDDDQKEAHFADKYIKKNDDDDEDDDEVQVITPPCQIIIDVDAELGLKPRTLATSKGRVIPGDSSERPMKRMKGGVPSAMYYTIAAKRIGLIDVEDGMRFGRDLSFEPLPFETIRAQIEDDIGGTASAAVGDDAMATETVSSSTAAASTGVRLAGDSEQVLAEAVAEPDDHDKLLSRSEDKSLVTDYIFLTIRQMAVCSAVPTQDISRSSRVCWKRSSRINCLGVIQSCDETCHEISWK
jgi:hypothetical protein